MNLINQIIEKKLGYYQEEDFKKRYAIAMWQFFECLNWSLAVLQEYNKKNIRKRNKFWKRYFSAESSDKKLKKMHNFIDKDMSTVVRSTDLIQKKQKEKPFESKDIDRDWAIAILSFEAPE